MIFVMLISSWLIILVPLSIVKNGFSMFSYIGIIILSFNIGIISEYINEFIKNSSQENKCK